ncbi:YIP1 family protein [Bacillus sp. SD088]|uniref:YIP1 family protein n=1 Tax=Bacillus sp. SD088 TaxID=2782012 RepID=UPI001A95EF94|nr:YIP1 family protein [Bacillus sp. SD088]MBO0993494.1 SMP-30/gluconolactonase/LRE family protein [Bacillus sp. SD088]
MKRIRRIWQTLFASISLTILFLSSTLTASAEVPYDTFSVDGFGQTIFTQPAYEPSEVLATDIYVTDESGESVYSSLKQPQDIFIDDNDEIYIADTGNNRVVHLDQDGELLREITLPDSPLNQPSGIFIDDKGDIYIADTGNKRVVRLDSEGNLIKEFGPPDSKYIDEKFVYEPINMIVDRRGFVFIVSRGTYQGVIQLDPDGEFFGFYGTNVTEVSLMDRIRNIFYTEEQLRRQVRLLPNPIRNIDIDHNGFIYTVSRDAIEQIKKINIRGENQWRDFSFGDNINLNFLRDRSTSQSDEEEGKPKTEITDVTVDKNGIVTVIDKASAIIAQFNQEGELLFFWGAPVMSGSPQVGVTKSPVALATNSENKIFILDDALNLVQVLQPTDFGRDIQTAYILTQEGKYGESEEYWKEIMGQNALFSPAYAGLARAAFSREDFNEALELYKLAGDEEGYSDSFWQIRLNWFQKNFSYFANAFIVIGVGSIIGARYRIKKRKVKKKKRISLGSWKDIQVLQNLKHAFFILKHPLDGMADIRYSKKGNYLSALIILVLVIAVALTRVYFTSFTFQPVPPGSLNAGSILLIGTVIWVSWVICHYLIGTIRYGQARFLDVFVGSAYSLIPVFLLGLPLALLSNIMTLSEGSIYNFFTAVMVIWCGALFFWMVQALQNYSVGEAIVNILLSLFSMVMLWVLIFIIVGLSSETIDFIYTLYQEVTM